MGSKQEGERWRLWGRSSRFLGPLRPGGGSPAQQWLGREGQTRGTSTKIGWQKWRTAFFLGAIPCIIAAHLSAFVFVDPDAHKRPEFKPYEYMRTRTKKFPWGDGNHTLFHNPHTNALPDGYETEEEHH